MFKLPLLHHLYPFVLPLLSCSHLHSNAPLRWIGLRKLKWAKSTISYCRVIFSCWSPLIWHIRQSCKHLLWHSKRGRKKKSEMQNHLFKQQPKTVEWISTVTSSCPKGHSWTLRLNSSHELSASSLFWQEIMHLSSCSYPSIMVNTFLSLLKGWSSHFECSSVRLILKSKLTHE